MKKTETQEVIYPKVHFSVSFCYDKTLLFIFLFVLCIFLRHVWFVVVGEAVCVKIIMLIVFWNYFILLSLLLFMYLF